ncbi:MAG: hypothetical protein COS85_20170 [Armatimonadetes bacterium CG07_land_8_20_14_0_80_59_28]|nr:MAG: hypothetical protein COS85_20170 [Armatimonadetes bacterium CG07_land_8_20_14_0_80_59_28]PIX40239.1 MAG: hypothetical protein COZ56_15245 [Armatimonadetes bacterium CG_4_8_14_3_um_filter_58_9]PJB68445.1 MAG: hypothetical protein CO095_11215 [Armatimonadetes bacterium CG_4_9_14_3_um_filter_58_7]
MKSVPAAAKPEEQEAFLVETLEPLIHEAQQGSRQLYFVDAAHFVLLPFLGYLYSKTVRFLRGSSGRKRFSVLGALNAVTQELVTITDHAYINALSVCALLEKLRASCQDLSLTVVMDNARYQKCTAVSETAMRLNIQGVFLPPYSPNLNLIERLWKFVKKQVLYNKFYSNYDHFCTAISDCLKETHTTHRNSLNTWLNPKFQTFERGCFQP